MPTYLAVVKVEPPGTTIKLADPNQPITMIHQDGEKRATIKFLTEKGEIVTVWFEANWPAPLSEIRMLASLFCHRFYAFISLLSNHFMQIFVVSVTNMESGQHEAFRESWPIQDTNAAEIEQDTLRLNEAFHLALTNGSLSVAVEDMRLATGHLWSGPFFCYRAVESVRQHFRAAADAQNKNPSWERMRTALRLDETYTRFLWDASNPIRHGDTVRIDIEQSIRCLTHARNVLFRFIEYLRVGALDESRYPVLTD
jgi:hypothetical protein